MQHEHAGIETKLARRQFAHHAVKVGMIVKAKRACFFGNLDPFLDLGVVDAHVVGIIDHDQGGFFADGRLEGFKRRVAIFFQWQVHHLEPRSRSSRRIARMRLHGCHHFSALTQHAAVLPIRPRNRRHGIGRVRAAPGLKDELIHPGKVAQDAIKVMNDFEHALQRIRVLIRMHFSQFGAQCGIFRRLGIVLHCAGSKEADPHHPQRHLAEVQVVPLSFELSDFWQFCLVLPGHCTRDQISANGRGHLGLRGREKLPARAWSTHFHDNRLIPLGSAKFRDTGHDKTSFNVAQSDRISAALCTSVTQKSAD